MPTIKPFFPSSSGALATGIATGVHSRRCAIMQPIDSPQAIQVHESQRLRTQEYRGRSHTIADTQVATSAAGRFAITAAS
jgi:hypothetical protein